MRARTAATNLARAGHHRMRGGRIRPGGGGVLTLEPSAICRESRTRSGAPSFAVSAGDSRAFANPCAAGGVAMKSHFDRIREVANRAIYHVISDRRRVMGRALPPLGGVHPDRRSDARFVAAATRVRKLSKDRGFPMLQRASASAARIEWTRERVERAWYVDCTSRPPGSAEGEGNQ